MTIDFEFFLKVVIVCAQIMLHYNPLLFILL